MNPAAAVEPIPLRSFAPWMAAAGALFLLVWLVAFDQGQISQAGELLHELMHDGRHTLGVPCH